MHPLVSIIIPVYNSEKYLSETVESAINQTWQNKEIIIVDDGSTDHSLLVAKGYENEMVKVFQQENKGASAARNKGLREAKGDYIQFLDADDLLHPNKIKNQVKLLNGETDKIALGPTVYFYDGTDPYSILIKHEWYKKGSSDPVDFLIKLYGGSIIGPSYGGMITIHSWLTPRKIVDKAGAWNEDLSLDDDGEFFCRVILASKEIVYSDNSINYYRKYNKGSSLSGQKTHQACKSALTANLLKASYLLSRTNQPVAKLVMSRYFWENAFTFYPYFKDLALLAEEKAKELAPEFKYKPYFQGVKGQLADLTGWKLIKILEKIQTKL